jgi:hypothetical protein
MHKPVKLIGMVGYPPVNGTGKSTLGVNQPGWPDVSLMRANAGGCPMSTDG